MSLMMISQEQCNRYVPSLMSLSWNEAVVALLQGSRKEEVRREGGSKLWLPSKQTLSAERDLR
jgi:hypothetical protein